MNIALELRTLIFEYALTCDEPIWVREPETRKEPSLIALLMANKQVCAEATPIFYKVNDFLFGNYHDNRYPSTDGVYDFLGSIPTESFAFFTKITLAPCLPAIRGLWRGDLGGANIHCVDTHARYILMFQEGIVPATEPIPMEDELLDVLDSLPNIRQVRVDVDDLFVGGGLDLLGTDVEVPVIAHERSQNVLALVRGLRCLVRKMKGRDLKVLLLKKDWIDLKAVIEELMKQEPEHEKMVELYGEENEEMM